MLYQLRNEKFSKLEVVEWDGKAYLNIFDTDLFFSDIESLEYHADELGVELKELQVVVCEKASLRTIDESIWEGDVDDTDQLPSEIMAALEDFNNAIEEHGSNILWQAGNKKVNLMKFENLKANKMNQNQKPWLVLVDTDNKTVDMSIINGVSALDAKNTFIDDNPYALREAIHVYPYSGDEKRDLNDEAGQSLVHLLSCIRNMQSDLAGAIGVSGSTPWKDMITALNEVLKTEIK